MGYSVDSAADRSQVLDDLDASLLRLRRLFERPGYRKRVLKGAHGVELGTIRLLRAVDGAQEAPSVGETAEALVIDPSTASRLVDEAVAAGYLQRRPCAQDRRRARLSLTDEGRDLLAEVTERRRDLLAGLTEQWDIDDLAKLQSLLKSLQSDFDRLESQ